MSVRGNDPRSDPELKRPPIRPTDYSTTQLKEDMFALKQGVHLLLSRQERTNQRIELLEKMMADAAQALTDLAASVQQIGKDSLELTTRVTSDIQALKAEIAQLQQNAPVPSKALDDLIAGVESNVAALAAAHSALAGIDPANPTPPAV